MRFVVMILFWLSSAVALAAAPLSRAEVEGFIIPPYALGDPVNDQGVWSLLNSGGAEAGYVFETGPLAPLPGFSGAPIDMLVMLKVDSFDAVITNRRRQEEKLAALNPLGPGVLDEDALHRFVSHYERLTRHMLEQMPARADVVIPIDRNQRPCSA